MHHDATNNDQLEKNKIKDRMLLKKGERDLWKNIGYYNVHEIVIVKIYNNKNLLTKKESLFTL